MWRKGQKRSRGKRTTVVRLSRESHPENCKCLREKVQGTAPKGSQAGLCVLLSFALNLTTVQESNKGGTVALVEVLMGACKGDITISLMDEFRILGGIKDSNFSSCLGISL